MKENQSKPAQARACGIMDSSPEWATTPFPSSEVLIAAVWSFAVLVGCNRRCVTPRNLDVLCLILHLLCLLGLVLTSVQDANAFTDFIFRVIYLRGVADMSSTRVSICIGSNLVGLVIIFARFRQLPDFDNAAVTGNVDQTVILILAFFLGVLLLRQAASLP